MACIIKQLGTSAIPRSSRTKIKKMKVNLAFPLRQADVTGFQNDMASEKTGGKKYMNGKCTGFFSWEYCRKFYFL